MTQIPTMRSTAMYTPGAPRERNSRGRFKEAVNHGWPGLNVSAGTVMDDTPTPSIDSVHVPSSCRETTAALLP